MFGFAVDSNRFLKEKEYNEALNIENDRFKYLVS